MRDRLHSLLFDVLCISGSTFLPRASPYQDLSLFGSCQFLDCHNFEVDFDN